MKSFGKITMPRDNRSPSEIRYSLELLLTGIPLEEANKQARNFYKKEMYIELIAYILSFLVLLTVVALGMFGLINKIKASSQACDDPRTCIYPNG